MAPIVGFSSKTCGLSLVTASTVADDEGYCWHPLVFVGQFTHPQLGSFEVTDRHAAEYIASFEAGVPGPGGIPIDEIGDHSPNANGAFGWVERVRAGTTEYAGKVWQAVLGGIRWTPLGTRDVTDQLFKYVSARFFVDDSENYYGRPNCITAAALCTRPLFWWQPELSTFAAAEGVSLNELRQRRQDRAERWGVSVRDDGRLTPAAAYREHAPNPQDYADPVNLKYPLRPESARAITAAHFAQSYGRYDEKSRRVVYTRIVRALRAAGIRHQPNPSLDPLLPPDLRAWVGAG